MFSYCSKERFMLIFYAPNDATVDRIIRTQFIYFSYALPMNKQGVIMIVKPSPEHINTLR